MGDAELQCDHHRGAERRHLRHCARSPGDEGDGERERGAGALDEVLR